MPTPILLLGSIVIRRARLWSRLQNVRVQSCERSEYVEGTHLTPEIPVLLYEVDTCIAETFRFLDRVSQVQSDLCIILLGREIGADRVAQLLRHGAFDYLTWPCSTGRLTESITNGLVNRRTFLEVRTLSDELARTNQAVAHDRDVLTECNRNLSVLNQLTQALAGSLDPAAIIKTLFNGLRQLVHADMLGLVRSHPEQVWTWSDSEQAEREMQVREDLLRRFDKGRCRITSAHAQLRLVRGPSIPLLPAYPAIISNNDVPQNITYEVPLAISPQSAGLLHIERSNATPFTEQEQQLLKTVGASLALTLRNADSYQHIHDLALQDPLTEVLNRRALDGPLARELRAGLRYGTPACLILLDLDYFKTVNDMLGHMAGDEVLKQVARLIQDTVREVDSVGRYGGEEFSIILPHTGLEQAQTLAERIRVNLERHSFSLTDSQVRLTASIGLASLQTSDIKNVAEWIGAADSALYTAKSQGRNRVVTHAPGSSEPAPVATICLAA